MRDVANRDPDGTTRPIGPPSDDLIRAAADVISSSSST
jgi:hypothetical protein